MQRNQNQEISRNHIHLQFLVKQMHLIRGIREKSKYLNDVTASTICQQQGGKIDIVDIGFNNKLFNPAGKSWSRT